ncbi:MAG TPA: radical SAM protein [Candidatus Hydrogenedens sp.]|nr:radical SAM protein [Candidatus Hydrogenedens sp.]HPP58626.1 radical SAM protein [Candidatus Hydrogenedens sp.]
MRIVLINLGYRKPMYPLATPPMGIMYLAGYLKREIENVEIKLINQKVKNDTPEELAKKIYYFSPDIVGLSSSTVFAGLIPIISEKIKELLPNCWVVLGGPHASSVKSQAFSECENLDVVVPGEGEIAFKNIVESYPSKSSLKLVPGLIWKEETGEVIENPGVLPIEQDLDKLPLPDYDLINIQQYWKLQSMTPLPPRKYMCLVTSRGCPYQCMWCHSIFGKKIRFCSPERIIEEIEWLNHKYGVNEFEFLDDNFNFNKQRVIQFSELVRQKGLNIKITFPNAIRGDLVTEDVAEALCSAGTYMSSFALETGSPRMQKFTCKNLDIPKFIKGIEIMVNKGVYANGFCMMGFPTETEEELQMTIDVATNSMLHTASFFTVIPFPGTPLFEWLRQNRPEKLKKFDYMNIDFAGAKINLTDLPDDVLFYYQRKANRQFFLKPSRIYRLLKVYPRPLSLIRYVPIYLYRMTKNIFQI